MKYLLACLLTLFLCSELKASLNEESPLFNVRSPSINTTGPDLIRMTDDAPSTPIASKLGNCFGRFLACWNKEKPEDEDPMVTSLPKGKGTSALMVGGAVFTFATLSAICSCGWCEICGHSGCCFNSDLFCIKLIGSSCCDGTCCGYVCGNGGCMKAGWISLMTAGGTCCLAGCCFISICLCHSMGSCDHYCDQLGMPNCAKGFRAGYTGKKVGANPTLDRPQVVLYQNQTSGH